MVVLCASADEGETDVSPARAAETTHLKDKKQASKKVEPGESTSESAASPEEDNTASGAEPVETENLTESKPTKSNPAAEPFVMLGSEVPPGTTERLSWVASESFTGISSPIPVLVAHGSKPGPTLCLTAAVHGDELNGIEMVRRVLYGLDPNELTGTVIGVPIVNLFGFRRGTRYLPDRRDLNRYFPGDAHGSSAARIANAFFTSVVSHCDYLVDLHTGSFHRTNLPQLRADLKNPEVLELTQGFGATAVLHNDGQVGTLRRAATDAGIPAITLEAGEPTRFQPEAVAQGVKGINTLLNKLGMVKHVSLWGDPQPIYYASDWIRADAGGILFSRVELGEKVEKGQILGTITDPINNNRSVIHAPESGRILGMALNQVVIPGFASFRIGIEKTSKEAAEKPDMPAAAAASESGSGATKTHIETVPAPEESAKNSSPNGQAETESDSTIPPKASKNGVDEERPD